MKKLECICDPTLFVLQSSFLYLTASIGEEAHVFIKSNDRRIHYNGTAFVVRNAGHSAGRRSIDSFINQDLLKIVEICGQDEATL